jgi:hypothetical protein
MRWSGVSRNPRSSCSCGLSLSLNGSSLATAREASHANSAAPGAASGHGPNDGESAYRRGSVRPLQDGVAIHLCGLPGEIGRAGPPTLGLAPGGVCRAARVTPGAGALLPHRFTLACASRRTGGPSAVCSLWHFPAGHPDWPLASTLPCGAPTFLSPPGEPDKPRPPGRLTVPSILAAAEAFAKRESRASPRSSRPSDRGREA